MARKPTVDASRFSPKFILLAVGLVVYVGYRMFSGISLPGDKQNVDGVTSAAVSDSVQKIDVIFGGGDYVAVRARYIGTQDGPMGPFPASDKKLELPYVGLLRFEDGQSVEIFVIQIVPQGQI